MTTYWAWFIIRENGEEVWNSIEGNKGDDSWSKYPQDNTQMKTWWIDGQQHTTSEGYFWYVEVDV